MILCMTCVHYYAPDDKKAVETHQVVQLFSSAPKKATTTGLGHFLGSEEVLKDNLKKGKITVFADELLELVYSLRSTYAPDQPYQCPWGARVSSRWETSVFGYTQNLLGPSDFHLFPKKSFLESALHPVKTLKDP